MAARRDIRIYQGDTFVHRLEIVDANENPVDVSGSTFECQIRKRASYQTVEATFAVDYSDANIGRILLSLTPPETESLLAGKYKYDIHQVTGTNILTLLYGDAEVVGEVTR
jgi:hypothetical protein